MPLPDNTRSADTCGKRFCSQPSTSRSRAVVAGSVTWPPSPCSGNHNPPPGTSKEDWEKQGDARFEASRLLEERDLKIHKEGMALFVEHYWSLWD